MAHDLHGLQSGEYGWLQSKILVIQLVYTGKMIKFRLYGRNLRNADLSNANLSNANLSGANLIGAFIENADLSGANLNDADLSNANLVGVKMSGTNLNGVKVQGAIFGDNIDLSKDVERDLENKGAIFNDSIGDRSGVLTGR